MVNRRAYSLPMHIFVINFVIDIIINLNSPSKTSTSDPEFSNRESSCLNR
jgi:hypothetical protein